MGKTQQASSSTVASSSSSTVAADKIRVLCLHGYRQDGDSFKSKLGSFRKNVQKYAEFVFVTAPHVAPPLEAEGATKEVDQQQRSWWFNKDDGTFKGTNRSGPAFGFDKSVRLVEQVWNEQGPFQGLLGFSQGASFVGLLCNMSARKSKFLRYLYVLRSSYDDCIYLFSDQNQTRFCNFIVGLPIG